MAYEDVEFCRAPPRCLSTRRTESRRHEENEAHEELLLQETSLRRVPDLPRRHRGVRDHRNFPRGAFAHERELIDALRLRLPVAHHLEIGAQVGQMIAVNGDDDVRDRLAERRRVWIAFQRGEPLVAGLIAVRPLAVSVARDDDDRLWREIGGDFVPFVIAEMEQERVDDALNLRLYGGIDAEPA